MAAGGHQQIDGPTFGSGMAVARRDDLTVADIRKATDWRDAHGGSWLAAAKVVGCSEHALRLAADPNYRPVHTPARPVCAYRPRASAGDGVSANRVTRERERARKPDTLGAAILLCLADSPMGAVGLSARTGRDRNNVNSALKVLEAEGVARGEATGDGRSRRWSLTPAGVAEAERLRDLIETREDGR